MRLNLHKISEHIQKLALVAIVFIPLHRHVTTHQIVVLWAVCGAILLVGIEVERRTL
jgi:hypothetical protein